MPQGHLGFSSAWALRCEQCGGGGKSATRILRNLDARILAKEQDSSCLAVTLGGPLRGTVVTAAGRGLFAQEPQVPCPVALFFSSPARVKNCSDWLYIHDLVIRPMVQGTIARRLGTRKLAISTLSYSAIKGEMLHQTTTFQFCFFLIITYKK